MKKIIIDADPGTDDTVAILLAANSPEFDIQGICTVAGNCSLENATKNTFKILDLANKNNIAVYKGMEKPLFYEGTTAAYVHGSNGMGGVEYEPINRVPENIHAVDYLISAVNNNPGEITVVALGPLTNIASAIKKEPSFVENIKELVIMGGSVGESNVSIYAEFNFFCDPDAADIVVNSNIPKITILGLNLTHQLALVHNLELRLKYSDNPLANFLYNITRQGAKHDIKEGLPGLPLHDPITFAYLIDDSIVKTQETKCTVETYGDKKGMLYLSPTHASNCYIGYEVDTEKFYKLLFKRILDWDI